MIINPGQGHVRHLHEHADELIYVISGTGTQTVGLEEFPISEGEAVYIPMGTLHSTMNTGWRTLRLIVTPRAGRSRRCPTRAAPGGRGRRLGALRAVTVGWFSLAEPGPLVAVRLTLIGWRMP